MRPKDVNGHWRTPFDPYQYENGFNESNGAQSTWFVPHDPGGLAELMGGKSKAVDKLQQQFVQAATFSGQPLEELSVRHRDLIKGGKLRLQMGHSPKWEK